MKLLIVLLASLVSVANCNRFAREMFYLTTFNYYTGFRDPVAFVRQLDKIANNYLLVVKKINNELDMELREASNYDLKSSDQSINVKAADIINKMQARQIVVDLVMYQIHLCYRMYSAATSKYTGEKVTPLFNDLKFDDNMSRMVIYEWVNQMGKLIKKISEIFEKTSEEWKIVREEINRSALGGEGTVTPVVEGGTTSSGVETTPADAATGTNPAAAPVTPDAAPKTTT